MEKEFQPDFMLNDFVNLPKWNFYVKLMIDGVSSRPFSASTIAPEKRPKDNFKDVIIDNSRRQYGTPRELVEERIAGEWMEQGGKVMDEKMFRRSEQPLAKVLKPKVDSVGHDEWPLRPAPPRPPEREKKKVDISDLRAALEKSLGSAPEEKDGREQIREE